MRAWNKAWRMRCEGHSAEANRRKLKRQTHKTTRRTARQNVRDHAAGDENAHTRYTKRLNEREVT